VAVADNSLPPAQATIRVKSMMSLAARLDELPWPIWFALAILGFIFWWPVGISILAYAIWSRKMCCCGIDFGRWRGVTKQSPLDGGRQPQTSGNQAFDEYRVTTLKRLEAEQREFGEFLSSLRMAKDKAEFDQFMADRRARSDASPSPV
jgi:hypothetical protein